MTEVRINGLMRRKPRITRSVAAAEPPPRSRGLSRLEPSAAASRRAGRSGAATWNRWEGRSTAIMSRLDLWLSQVLVEPVDRALPGQRGRCFVVAGGCGVVVETVNGAEIDVSLARDAGGFQGRIVCRAGSSNSRIHFAPSDVKISHAIIAVGPSLPRPLHPVRRRTNSYFDCPFRHPGQADQRRSVRHFLRGT